MNIGDKFILTVPFDHYHDANQGQDDNLTEEEYNTYFFNKLVTIHDTGVKLSRGEKWFGFTKDVDDMCWSGYLPEDNFSYEAITDESEIQKILASESEFFEKVKKEEAKRIAEKDKRIAELNQKRDDFFEKALLSATAGAVHSTYPERYISDVVSLWISLMNIMVLINLCYVNM